MNLTTFLGFFALALGLSIYPFIFLRRLNRLKTKGGKAIATILDSQLRRHFYGTAPYLIQVEFQTSDGRKVEATSTVGVSIPPSPGTTTVVYYNCANPSNFMQDSLGEKITVLFPPAIIWLGLFISLLAGQ
jgi:hypothetical protein